MFGIRKLKDRIESVENELWEHKHPFQFQLSDEVSYHGNTKENYFSGIVVNRRRIHDDIYYQHVNCYDIYVRGVGVHKAYVEFSLSLNKDEKSKNSK